MRLERPSPAMVVALLALFIALGGAGYAAVKLPRNSVGPKQLKRNAVTSAKVRNHSLLGKDFRAGQLPAGAKGEKGDTGQPGPTFGATTSGSSFQPAADPVASPDEPPGIPATIGRHFDVNLPAAGKVYVRYFNPLWGADCSNGGARAGLYFDGAPVPKTLRPLAGASAPQATQVIGIVAASAGAHALEVQLDCPNGNLGGQSVNLSPDWTVLLLG